MAAADPRLSPSSDLSGRSVGRFLIRNRIGAGGMGEVYSAEDTRLKRPVALKRVSPKLGAEPHSRERILKEAERASALNCPYIAAVYDVMEQEGEVFLVMEYVEGTTLRQRLRISGRFPVSEFLGLALQCAEALDVAQKKGIVHRDLKPDNIMITPAGQIKILDFGLAKRLPTGDEIDATLSGESLQWIHAGTPGYIAPEVLLGGAADPRSDLFSLGVVFYEMLTGRHPFRADDGGTVAGRTLQQTPAAVRELAPEVPAEAERIVAKMLAKSPDERYASAADLLADLHAIEPGRQHLPLPRLRARLRAKRMGRSAAVVVLVLVALGISPMARQQWKRWFVGPDLPEKKNLAVLPFAVLGDAPEAHAFAQGLAETLTGKLAQLTDDYPLQVVPPSEIRSQKVDSVEQARIGLGANLVLEGSLQRFGPQVRIAYHLVDARNHQQLRGDTVTAQTSDPFAVEDRVVQSVVRSLELELGAKQRRALEAHGTSEPEAYDYYLQGRGYLMEYAKPENVDSAIQLFQRALERDPNYTLAFAGLGESYWRKYETTHAPEWMTKALDACEKAAAQGEGATCLGDVYNSTGKYEKAVEQFQRALQLDRTSDDAYRGLAFAYEHLGKIADAEQTYRHAITVRPQYWAGYNWLGTFLFRQGRFAEAASAFQQVTALAPDNVRGYQNLGGAYTALGQFNQAIPLLEHAVALRPSPTGYSNLATVYFYLRRFSDAARTYEKAVKLDNRDFVLWGNLAEAYYWSPGERDRSINAYHQAVSLGEAQLKVNPRDSSALGQIAVANAMLGDRGAAAEYLGRALALASSDPDLQLKAAIVETRLGHSDRAVDCLARALASGISPELIRTNPVFDELAKSQRLQKLLRDKQAS
jgi:tetratricopeptide (TPR) repeat protein/predicted Ser/Thr protein kinase